MKKTALFELGFRPFFLCAGFSAIFLVLGWLLMFQGQMASASYYGPFLWHSHEMIFGYAVAVIAGFLLTSVRNWTGLETARHGRLASLVVLWLLGRVLPFFDYFDPRVVAVVDLLFLPALAITIGIPLVKSDNRRNLFFIPLFAFFTICNLLIHLQALQLLEGWGDMASRACVGLVVVMITVIGGRVIPFFSSTAIPGYKAEVSPWLDRTAVLSALVFALVYGYQGQLGNTIGWVALFAAGVSLLRIRQWYCNQIWSNPLLWILYTSYGWLVVGFCMFFAEAFFPLIGKPALHAITIGTIGGMTLGMMVRVCLGHSGRPLKVSTATTLAFILINLACILRVSLPVIYPELYAVTVTVSGGLWILAFLIFLVAYTPVLVFPRIDGKPG